MLARLLWRGMELAWVAQLHGWALIWTLGAIVCSCCWRWSLQTPQETWETPPLLCLGASSCLQMRKAAVPSRLLLGGISSPDPTGLIFLDRGGVRLGADMALLPRRRAAYGPRWFNTSDNNNVYWQLLCARHWPGTYCLVSSCNSFM